jgi:cbb3-type cytochrome oxidase subunit 1
MIGGLMIVVGQVILAYNVWQTARGTIRAKQYAAAVLPVQEAQF